MPLLIDLKPGEKVIINGAVIENAGANTKLRVHNESNIMRQKEILDAEDAITPAARVYFSLQCAYIFPDKRQTYLHNFQEYLADYAQACPSAMDLVTEILEAVRGEHYYHALKSVRKLVKHEAAIFEHMEKSAKAALAAAKAAPSDAGG